MQAFIKQSWRTYCTKWKRMDDLETYAFVAFTYKNTCGMILTNTKGLSFNGDKLRKNRTDI